MKKSKSTKLRLDVETIRTLNPSQLTAAAGGSISDSQRCTDECPTDGCGHRTM